MAVARTGSRCATLPMVLSDDSIIVDAFEHSRTESEYNWYVSSGCKDMSILYSKKTVTLGPELLHTDKAPEISQFSNPPRSGDYVRAWTLSLNDSN